jgi:hypothetical protein
MVQPKLGDVLEPLKDDCNTQTQNSIVIFKNPCPSSTTSGIIINNKCCLDILYDNALDDGPILIDNSPCIHEDKNDEFASCDDALIHENPILFLKSPIYTMEEKYAYVEKYLGGLQLSCKISYSSHDTIKNGTKTTLKEESMLMNAIRNL